MLLRRLELSLDKCWSGHDWWSVGLGLGLSPVAPGTMGSFLGVLLAVGISLLPAAFSLLLLGCMIAYSVWAASHTAKKLLGDDPSVIVSDEVVGFICAVWGWPCQVFFYFCAFLVFRIVDILKPWPVSWVDRLHCGGVSIVGDDVLAGLITNLILWSVWVVMGWG